MPDNQNPEPVIVLPVDDGVGEIGQRVDSPTICRRRSNAWMSLKQTRYPLELIEESFGKTDSSFALVEPSGLGKILRG